MSQSWLASLGLLNRDQEDIGVLMTSKVTKAYCTSKYCNKSGYAGAKAYKTKAKHNAPCPDCGHELMWKAGHDTY